MCLAFKLNSVQLYFFSDVTVLFPPTTEETGTRETTAFWEAETLSGSHRWWLVLFYSTASTFPLEIHWPDTQTKIE